MIKNNNQSEQLVAVSNPKTAINFVNFALHYANDDEINNFMYQLNCYLSGQALSEQENQDSVKMIIKTNSTLNRDHQVDLINVVTLVNLEQDFNSLFSEEDNGIIDLLKQIKHHDKVKNVLVVDYLSTAIIDQ